MRNRINLKQEEALYLFVQGKNLIKSGNYKYFNLSWLFVDSTLSEVYAQYKDEDGFLYIEYCEYSSFGGEKFLNEWVVLCKKSDF